MTDNTVKTIKIKTPIDMSPIAETLFGFKDNQPAKTLIKIKGACQYNIGLLQLIKIPAISPAKIDINIGANTFVSPTLRTGV